MLRVTSFPDIIKAATMFIKTTFKDSKKVKRMSNYVLKCNLYLYFSSVKCSELGRRSGKQPGTLYKKIFFSTIKIFFLQL